MLFVAQAEAFCSELKVWSRNDSMCLLHNNEFAFTCTYWRL